MDDPQRESCIRDFVALQRGNTYKSALLGQPGPVLLGLASISRNGGFKDGNLKTYGGVSDLRILLKPGDIYVSLKDVTQSADLLGAVSRVPSFIEEGRLTQDTVKLSFKSGNAPTDYIYWLLRTPDYRAYCKAHATGTTNLGLSREDFLAFPVPQLTDARYALVALIQALEDKIELNRRMSGALETTMRTIFEDWFVDFGPTRAKAEDRAPYLGTGIWDLFPKAFDEEGKPLGWRYGGLKQVADSPRNGVNPAEILPDTAYIGLEHMPRRSIALSDWDHAEKVTSNKSVFEKGDFLFGKLRPYFHKVGVAPLVH